MAMLLLAPAAVLMGALLVWWSVRSRETRGLGSGETVALDDLVLYSQRLKLVGRPDRIVRQGKLLVPEEWKSSNRVHRGHELQLGAYFLLIEDEFGERPPHGFVVLGDGSRIRVENTEKLRSEVLRTAHSPEHTGAPSEPLGRDSGQAASGEMSGVRPA